MIFFLVILSVAISAVAQLLLKLGMSSGVVKRAIDGGDLGSMMLTIGLNPLILGGLALYFFGAIVWLFVLSRLPLGVAYPFVALGFVFTALLAYFVLHESFSPATLLGTLLIIVGVVILSRGLVVPA